MMTLKGFFKNLFDINFKEFITKVVIKYLYLIAIIALAIGALSFLIASIARGGWGAFLAILLAPIGFIVYLLIIRIWLELVLVIFKIADNTDRMAPPEAEPAAPDTTAEPKE
jgi:hypothetical protein